VVAEWADYYWFVTMVAPVTGPFTDEIGGTGEVDYYSWKRGYRQVKPFDIVLNYERKTGVRTMKSGSTPYDARSVGAVDWIGLTGSYNALNSRVYDKLKDKISSSANLAVNLAEMNQSLAMMRSRLMQMYQFGKALNRWDFLGAARTLRMATVPKRVSTKRSVSSNYLEYHFGWAPLLGDVYSAVDLLQSPIKDSHVRVSSRDWIPRMDLENPQKGSNNANYPNPYSWDSYRYITGEKRLSMGCTVSVSNPNLHLANQLGLTNPALFVYEKIPFSFVADWFFNVEQFLSLGTDFMGLTLSKTWSTQTVSGHYVQYLHNLWKYFDLGSWHYGVDHREMAGNFCHMRRVPGLTSPTFGVRPWRPWGWRRVAAAASLTFLQVEGFRDRKIRSERSDIRQYYEDRSAERKNRKIQKWRDLTSWERG
jgi:hypothetical protein